MQVIHELALSDAQQQQVHTLMKTAHSQWQSQEGSGLSTGVLHYRTLGAAALQRHLVYEHFELGRTCGYGQQSNQQCGCSVGPADVLSNASALRSHYCYAPLSRRSRSASVPRCVSY